MAEEQSNVKEKLDSLNAKIREAGEWAEGLFSDMQSYYDERSDKWQEGDAGQSYDAWKSEYESLDVDEVDIEFPEDLEVPGCDVADNLESLPDEP